MATKMQQYSIYLMGPDDRVVEHIVVPCVDDADAIQQAKQLSSRHGLAQLWQASRFIASFYRRSLMSKGRELTKKASARLSAPRPSSRLDRTGVLPNLVLLKREKVAKSGVLVNLAKIFGSRLAGRGPGAAAR